MLIEHSINTGDLAQYWVSGIIDDIRTRLEQPTMADYTRISGFLQRHFAREKLHMQMVQIFLPLRKHLLQQSAKNKWRQLWKWGAYCALHARGLTRNNGPLATQFRAHMADLEQAQKAEFSALLARDETIKHEAKKTGADSPTRSPTKAPQDRVFLPPRSDMDQLVLQVWNQASLVQWKEEFTKTMLRAKGGTSSKGVRGWLRGKIWGATDASSEISDNRSVSSNGVATDNVVPRDGEAEIAKIEERFFPPETTLPQEDAATRRLLVHANIILTGVEMDLRHVHGTKFFGKVSDLRVQFSNNGLSKATAVRLAKTKKLLGAGATAAGAESWVERQFLSVMDREVGESGPRRMQKLFGADSLGTVFLAELGDALLRYESSDALDQRQVTDLVYRCRRGPGRDSAMSAVESVVSGRSSGIAGKEGGATDARGVEEGVQGLGGLGAVAVLGKQPPPPLEGDQQRTVAIYSARDAEEEIPERIKRHDTFESSDDDDFQDVDDFDTPSLGPAVAPGPPPLVPVPLHTPERERNPIIHGKIQSPLLKVEFSDIAHSPPYLQVDGENIVIDYQRRIYSLLTDFFTQEEIAPSRGPAAADPMLRLLEASIPGGRPVEAVATDTSQQQPNVWRSRLRAGMNTLEFKINFQTPTILLPTRFQFECDATLMALHLGTLEVSSQGDILSWVGTVSRADSRFYDIPPKLYQKIHNAHDNTFRMLLRNNVAVDVVYWLEVVWILFRSIVDDRASIFRLVPSQLGSTIGVYFGGKHSHVGEKVSRGGLFEAGCVVGRESSW